MWYQDTVTRGPIVVANLDIRPDVDGALQYAFRMFNTDGLTIHNCTIAEYGSTNIILSNNVNNTLINKCRILDARSSETYEQGLYCGSVDGVTIRDTVFDNNGTLDADGNVASLSRRLRAHNMYFSPASKNIKIERVISTRAAGIGMKCQSESFEIRDCVMAYNPIGMGLGLDPSKTVSRGAVGVVDNVIIIDGTDYPESNRSQGLGVNSQKDTVIRNVIVSRCRQPIHVVTQITVKIDGLDVIVPIEKLLIESCTMRGHMVLFSNGKKYDGLTLKDNVFQHTEGLSSTKEFVYFHNATPVDAVFDNNTWFNTPYTDFVTKDDGAVFRGKFDAFAAKVGATGKFEESPPANASAGLETFTGKSYEEAITDVRGGQVNVSELLGHLRDGLE